MNIARNHISKSIREYRVYKESFLPGQIKGMLFLTGLFGLYAIVAPIVLGSMMHFYINSVVEGQFTFLVFACGIPFVGFAYMLWSKKLSYKVKSILYEILMAMIFLAIGVIYPYYALTKTYLGGDYADYTVFFIIALVMLITFEVHPFLFVGGFGLSIVSIIVWMNGMDFILPKQVYNLLIFSIATLILYIVKYMARVKSHMRGLRIAEMQKQREEFMVQLTHEMRTPLNAVLGKNQMILADTAEDNTRVLSKQINGSGRMLLSLINDILDRAKLESGKMNIVVSEYNPYEMASDVGSIMRTMAEEHGLEYVEEIADDMPHILCGDEIRIKQIILNLISNGIKYTPSGSVTLKMNYTRTEGDEGTLNVSVTDTGIGIKEEDIPKLAQLYVRVDEDTNKSIQGTGLGLSISTSLLSLMGTELEISSVYGEGSTFAFAVKQKYVDVADSDSEEISSKTYEYPDAKILVVDDNKVNITVLKGLLAKNKIQPDYAYSGPTCLALVAKKKYDIIFLDHMMPVMNGIETLGRLRGEYQEQIEGSVIIALTANYESNAQELYESLGFDAYLAKPVEVSKLNATLNKYL